ncbi:MAG: class I tRNA ligase family protein [Candidatus Beckwithbacteria bacterium]|nr:class I tRNA ligase family protein [Candidatus Beckwithbacteria bacterium]
MSQKPFFKDEPAVPNFVDLEEKLLKNWDQQGIVKQYLAKNAKSKKKFSFLDGPITANNPMGVHHARGRTYKDLWQRYFTMKGYAGRYQNGFDCQGLWVEVEVEKELGFRSKRDIAKYGVEKFVNQCKARVLKYSAIQTKQSQRLGMWCDWANSYFTMSDANNYAIWHFLKVCHERNWLYKGHDSVPWCPRCETAISQHEMLTEDYKEIVHQAIYLELPLVNRTKEYLLVWTTTPWTIPANISVAVDKKLDYSLVEGDSGNQFWVVKDRVQAIFGPDPKIIKTIKGKELVGLQYSAPFDDLAAVAAVAKKYPAKFHRVIATDTLILPVTTTEGTGLIHTAVSAGAEDFKLGQKYGLPLIPVISDNADYLPELGWLAGLNAKKHPEIILDYLTKLDASGHDCVFKIEPYKHRYPACWRCKSELVWKVTDEWYIAMDRPDPTDKKKRTLRQELMAVAKKVNWIPSFGLERELDWLQNMHDWLISKKNRYWGLALPIYECPECGHFEVIGSKEELKKQAVSGWDQFSGHTPHKPWVDYVKTKCSHCGTIVSRVEPVGNPWLDAGIVPFSTLPEAWFPADFITEAFPGQFKNWFYAMLVMSTVLKKTNPYKTVLGYESVVGEDGRPMHKSWGNAIEFNDGAQKIGVDIMRWMYCQTLPTAVLPFGFRKAEEIRRQFFLILWNSYRFFTTQANVQNWQPPLRTPYSAVRTNNILDRWIISRLNQTIKVVTGSLDKYYTALATETLEKFISDFSTWYIRRSRNRPQSLPVMYHSLVILSQLLAPFIPFLSEYLFRQLTHQQSVHLSDWPKADPALINQSLEKDMLKARQLVELIHSQRKALNLKVRQPLAKATVNSPVFGSSELRNLILEETNIKKLIFKGKGDGKVILDTKLTPQLEAEGKTRDLIRAIQSARKQAGTSLDEEINLELPDWPKAFEAEIKKKTLVKKLILAKALKVIRLCRS